MFHVPLTDQWRLVRAASRDLRLSRGDLAVLIEVIDRYWKPKGNSRASSRFLETVLGITRRTAIRSLHRLRKNGYLAVVRMGHGTRPTEFLPNFKLAASGDMGDTTNHHPSGDTHDTTSAHPIPEASGDMGDTTGVTPVSPLEPASGVMGVTHTYLLSPADRSGGQIGRTSSEVGTRGAASPPLLAASGAAVPPRVPVVVSSLSGFAELWAPWPAKYARPQAKAAYAALAPDAALHAELVVSAKAWAAHYQENNVDPKWVPRLHNWIKGERWLEDVPAVYEDPKEAAIANRRGSGRYNKTGTGSGSGPGSALPRGVYHAKVVAAPVSSGEHACLQLELEIIDGPHQGRKMVKELKFGRAYTREELLVGRQLLSALCHCGGKSAVSNPSQLLDIELSLRIDPALDGGLEFKPILKAA